MNVGIIIVALAIGAIGVLTWARESGADSDLAEWLKENWKYIVAAFVAILLVYGLFFS